ncbi:hypothetical protein DFQ26_001177 [Actinomortierella ambigua]|nr:hypothetical protein DFQ26_001177 [Actinomortierella ambigua]
MKSFVTLAVLSIVAYSAQAWCMNAHDKDAINITDLKDGCGSAVNLDQPFVLYDEIYGNYLGYGKKNWLTLTKTAPAGFFWQRMPTNPNIIFLKGTVGDNCSLRRQFWFTHPGRFLAPTSCHGGAFLEFRKWDKGQCKSDWCYQVGLLDDDPVNGAITNYESEGFVAFVDENCAAKKYKWVLKKPKEGVSWNATYSLNELQTC